MKRFFTEAEAIMVRLFNAYTVLQRSPHEYYPGIELYPSEIHAIECVATEGPLNFTELSKMLGVTRGAVSKCVVKLEKTGLVRRYKYVSNQKEVYLHLTDLGEQAYKGHVRYHEAMNRTLERYGDEISDEKGDEILCFLNLYLEEMRKLGEEKSK